MTRSSFAASLPGAFGWLFLHRTRVAVWLALSLGLALGRWWPRTGLRRASALGPALASVCVMYAISYCFGVVRRTTHPHDPGPRELFRSELEADDAFTDFLQGLGALLVSYLPILAFAGYVALRRPDAVQDPAFQVAGLALGLAGTLYLPMALLLLGFTGDWRAGFNLPLGLRSVPRLGIDYAVCAGVFAAVLAASVALERSWVSPTAARTFEAFLARAGTSLVEVGLAIGTARALGLMYLARGERLDWISKRET